MKLMNIVFAGVLLSISILLQGCKPMPTPNFQNITLPNTENYYLVCPEGYCQSGSQTITPNAYSPVYPISAEDLFTAWNEMLQKQARVAYTYSIPESGQYGLVQHLVLVNLPDDISVQFVALPNNQSSLAIISKSRYLMYDFGLNKKRIDSWMQQLGQIVAVKAAANQNTSVSPTDNTAAEDTEVDQAVAEEESKDQVTKTLP